MAKTNIITRTIETIVPYTDTPIEFITSGCYAILAETIGRFYKLDGTLGRRKFLNLFNIIGSPPHIGHRSDLIECMGYIAKVAINTYYTLMINDTKKKEDKEKLKELLELDIQAHALQTGGSTEGLMDVIERLHKEKIRSFLVIDSEIGKTFESMNKSNSYMSGTADLLCRLFTRDSKVSYYSDKTTFKDEDKKIMRKLPTDISFTILGAMQNPENYFCGKNAQVGMLRRLWITALRGKDLPIYQPLISNKNKNEMYTCLKKIGQDIGRMMYRLKDKRYHSIELKWNDEVIAMINAFDKKYVMDARENDDDEIALSKVTFGEMCCKVAGLTALSDGRDTITTCDVEYAKKILIKTATRTDIALQNMNVSEEKKRFHKNYDMFLGYIKEGLSPRIIQSRFSGKYGTNRVIGKDWKALFEAISVLYCYTKDTGWVKK